MKALDIARSHQKRRVTLAQRTAAQFAKLWQSVDVGNIAASWRAAVPRATAVLESAQTTAAASSGTYLDALLSAYGLSAGAAAEVRVTGFAGTASDGRPLDSLLFLPAVTALDTIRKTKSAQRGMSSGRLLLEAIVRTQVADAGRVADGVALVARPQLSGWARMLSLPSCARCVLLAGKVSQWEDPFERHPLCDCTHIPASEDVAGDLRTDPKAYFNSLSEKEQDRIFTIGGAQAIRDGANMGRVINARMGIYTAGGRKYTTEAVSRTRRPRLMPEAIYAEADGNRKEALRLLKLHGYLTR